MTATNRLPTWGLVGLVIIALGCPTLALGEEVCSGIRSFRDTLERNEIPNNQQLEALVDCLKPSGNWASWKETNNSPGVAIADFLKRNLKTPVDSIADPEKLVGQSKSLQRISWVLARLRDLSEEYQTLPEFNDVAVDARTALAGKTSVEEMSFIQGTLATIPTSETVNGRLSNYDRSLSLDGLIGGLDAVAWKAHQRAVELELDQLKLRFTKLEEKFSVSEEGGDSYQKVVPGSSFPAYFGALAGALSLLLWTLLFAIQKKKRLVPSTSRETKFPPTRHDSTEVSGLKKRLEDLAQQQRDLEGGKAARGELTTLREVLEGQVSEAESSWQQALQSLSLRLHEFENQTPSSAPVAAVQRVEEELRLATAQQKTAQTALLGQVEKLQQLSSLPDQLEARRLAGTLELERQALRELWEKVQGSLQGTTFQESLEGSDSDWRPKVDQIRSLLPERLQSSEDLSRAALVAAQPVAEASTLLSKFTVIKKILGETRGEVTPVDGAAASRKLFQMRDFSFHLLSLLNTDEGRRRLQFRLADWVREDFRGFADQFFRQYWQLELEGRQGNLEAAKDLVAEILLWGQLQVIEIIPGKTRFDSSLHMGRSTATNSSYPEGAILGVVRVGFRDLTTDRVLQRPEVIVNRR